MAVAPSAFAAATPASEEPDTNTPGTSASGNGGVSFSLDTLWNAPS